MLFLSLTAVTSLMSQKSVVESVGDVFHVLLPGAAGASTLLDPNAGKAWLEYGIGGSITLGTTLAVKRITKKRRPNGMQHAFPSGHTSASFYGATFLTRKYGWKIGIPTLLMAGYTGWSRVYAQKHDWWDVGAGAVLGTAVGYLFTSRPVSDKVDLDLSIQGNGGVLHVGVTF